MGPDRRRYLSRAWAPIVALLVLLAFAAPASAASPPSMATSFTPNTIGLNGFTSLSFTISNPNPGTSLTGVAFSDTLPVGLTVPSASATVCGGTVTLTPPRTIGITGATIAASGQCQFSVTVTGTASGSYTNTTGAVTSSNGGTGNTSSASLTVNAPPSLAATFTPAAIGQSGTTSLGFVITNPSANPDALTGVAFTDTLPVGLTVPSASAPVCGGTVTLTPPRTISITGATISSDSQCIFSITVTGVTVGSYTNTTGAVSATNGGTGNAASAQLLVGTAEIQQSFGAASIAVGSSTSMTFTVQNQNSSLALTGVRFTDSLPAGLAVSPAPAVAGSCGGGTITAAAGSTSVGLTGATLAPGASCVFSVSVTGASAGTQVNSTGGVASNEAPTGPAASASIDVLAPPELSIGFAPAAIAAGQSSQLTFTVTNPSANALGLTAVAFSDTLPAGLVISSPSGLTGACGGGTITAPAGGSTVTLDGASLPGSGRCTFSVSVTGANTGVKTATTGAPTSANGGTGSPSTATLAVLGPPAVTISIPKAKARYITRQRVVVRYSCADDPNGPGIASCSGPVASGARLRTTKAGTFKFTVTATTKDGRTASTTVTYTVSKPPGSRITGLHGTVAAKTLTAFRGTASRGSSRLKSVAISLERVAGGAKVAAATTKPRCWALSARGTLKQVKAKRKVCPALTFLKATGTSKWTFRLKHPLPAGTYVLTSRATDSDRVAESAFSAKRGNRVQFTVH